MREILFIIVIVSETHMGGYLKCAKEEIKDMCCVYTDEADADHISAKV